MECSTASSPQTSRYLWEQPSLWLPLRCLLRFSLRGGHPESIRWSPCATSRRLHKIGRASCRERVLISGDVVSGRSSNQHAAQISHVVPDIATITTINRIDTAAFDVFVNFFFFKQKTAYEITV